jgi:hypothetical protein
MGVCRLNVGGSEGSFPVFAEDILHYLIHHPEAADTVQGILQWWLHQECGEGITTQVQSALDFLADKGWLMAVAIPAPKVYRINETRMTEINSFLSASTEKKD